MQIQVSQRTQRKVRNSREHTEAKTRFSSLCSHCIPLSLCALCDTWLFSYINLAGASAVKVRFRGFRGIAIFLLLLSLTNILSAQNWQWARGAGGQATSNVMCADASGNVYVAGYFVGQVTFSNDTINNGNSPYQYVFLAKYDALGNLLWLRNSNGYSDVYGVSADASSNVYLVGNFYNDSVSFGSITLTNPTPGPQNSNIYLIKYDVSGNLVWAKNLGGINNDIAAGLATDASGNVYVSGNFMGDSLTLGIATVQHIGNSDGFVAKLNSSGDALWIRNVGGPVSVGAGAVCTDTSGNVFLSGYFQYNYMYTGSLSSLVESPYTANVFITKYDSSGNNLWLKYAGGNYGPTCTGISADDSGNVYITGACNGLLSFGFDTIFSSQFRNIYTAKYNASGTLVWAETAGGNGLLDQPNGISADAQGNTYLTGYYESDSVFFGSSTLTNAGGNNISIIAKYDPYGNPQWAIAPSGNSTNQGIGISYANNSIYVAGTFQGSSLLFGMDTLRSPEQIYVAKLDSLPPATGISSIHKTTDNILVYPNPSAGIFYFAGLKNESTIEVYDLLGNLLYAASPGRALYPIDLSARSKGVYFYRVSDRGTTIGQGRVVLE